jgi:hypothetical protein
VERIHVSAENPASFQLIMNTSPETQTKEGEHGKPDKNHVDIAIVTTSGSWPDQGFESVPIHQPVKVQLHRAAKELRITDTTNWIAKVRTRELNVDQNYLENNLSGQVEIDYGPREGGGGNE